MRISFHGAARTVTGSRHLLEINGYKLLLECGLYQGRRQEAFERNRKFEFNPAKLDAVILSHAHIDHSGNLPSLVKKGYYGPIYATHATAHLANLMLLMSATVYRGQEQLSMDQGVQVHDFYLHAFWIMGFALLSVINLYQLIKPPKDLEQGGSWGHAFLRAVGYPSMASP